MKTDTNEFLFAAVITVIIVAALWFFKESSMPFKDAKAINCIIGEAEGEPYNGKLYVAHAILNRKSLMGVNGCSSRRVREKLYAKQSAVDSELAWAEAKMFHEKLDPTFGANHWLSKEDIASEVSWVNNCKPTVKIGNHTFFKCE